MEIERYNDGLVWTESFGYVRAVRVGDQIYVSGTTGSSADGSPVATDVYTQTAQALEKIGAAIEALGASAVVVRTRVFLVEGADWTEAGRAHLEAFAEAPPASTALYVSGLVGEGLLVEVEADAVVLPD